MVLDIAGGAARLVVEGLTAPVLDQLRPDPNAPAKSRKPAQTLNLAGAVPVHHGSFAPGEKGQEVRISPSKARYLCLEASDSHQMDPFTTVAEFLLLNGDGHEIPRQNWRVIYADSEELTGDDGAAANAIDGHADTFWHTEWEANKPAHPHHLVIELGREENIGGFRYVPRQDSPNGRIKNYRIHMSVQPFGLLMEPQP
jgi:beta-galactosidase